MASLRLTITAHERVRYSKTFDLTPAQGLAVLEALAVRRPGWEQTLDAASERIDRVTDVVGREGFDIIDVSTQIVP